MLRLLQDDQACFDVRGRRHHTATCARPANQDLVELRPPLVVQLLEADDVDILGHQDSQVLFRLFQELENLEADSQLFAARTPAL